MTMAKGMKVVAYYSPGDGGTSYTEQGTYDMTSTGTGSATQLAFAGASLALLSAFAF